MEKKLVVNCDICDTRKANEEDLKKFEKICINADLLLVDEKSKAMLNRLPIECKLDETIQLEEKEEIGVINYNGKYEITKSLSCTEKKLLFVNGLLVIHPGTEEVLKSFIRIFVNGSVNYPDSMSAYINRIFVNGKMESYPDNYTMMEYNWILDPYFPIRAKENGNYFSAQTIEITNKAIDTSLLLKKGVHFKTKELYVLEEKLKDCAELFSEDVKFQVVPTGFEFIKGNTIFENDLLLKYGNRLYVKGDFILEEKNKDDFSKIEALHITGTLYLPEGQIKQLNQNILYDQIETIKGNAIWKGSIVNLDKEMLSKNPKGISLIKCAIVQIDPTISEQELSEKVCLIKCAVVKCNKEQRAVIESIGNKIAKIQCEGEENKIETNIEKGTQVINADRYIL